ncbi:MAG: SelL-related redox protein [Pirellulales bacterium]
MPCREHLSQLRQQVDALETLNVRVVAVTFESGWLPEAYVEETELPWPLLIDDSRRLYAAYDMSRGHGWNLFGPAALGSYAKLLLRGRRIRRPTGDVYQLGGDVLIDPNGIVRLHHVGNGPADRPEIDSLLQIAKAPTS